MIVESMKILMAFEEKCATASSEGTISVDRKEVVAHATIHAWVSHWPSLKSEKMDSLLKRNEIIYRREPSRWKKQRRIASHRLGHAFHDVEFAPRVQVKALS